MAQWLLQMDPNKWRMRDFLADGHVLADWTVRRYLDQPTTGDPLVIWASGKGGGVVATGRVTGEVIDGPVEPDPYWSNPEGIESAHLLPIQIDNHFLDEPVARTVLAQDPDFAESLILRAPHGANPFPLSDREWRAIQRHLDAESISRDAWDLAPGDRIKRVELHRRWGGSGQSGISPSALTPNVLVFSDPKAGIPLGYVDEWAGDDVFIYTGEGQTGDQQMKAGNRAILEHQERGRALRVFDGARGAVQYMGRFVVDPDSPWQYEPARQRGSEELRRVIRFRLLRVPDVSAPPARKAAKTGIPYQSQDEDVSVAIAANPATNPDAVGRGLRTHRRLQNGLAEVVTDSGGMPLGPSPRDPSFDLAWYVNETHIVVCEMKSLTLTNEIHQLRLGLGQVLDYAHALRARCDTVTPVLYVPRQPTDPRWNEIAHDAGVLLRWPGNLSNMPLLSVSQPVG